MNNLKHNFRGLTLLGMAIGVLLNLNLAFAKDGLIDLIDIKTTQEKDKIRVNLVTDLVVQEYDSFTMGKPPAIVVDLPNTQCVPRDVSVGANGITRIQTVQEENKTRVIINLVKIAPYYTKRTKDGIELIIDNPYFNYKLTDIQIKESQEQLKIYISADALPQYKYFDLSNPPRIIIDFLNADLTVKSVEKGKGCVKEITTAQRQTEPVKVARVTIELKAAQSYEVISEHSTVIVDLSKEKEQVKEEAVSLPEVKGKAAPIIKKAPTAIKVGKEKPVLKGEDRERARPKTFVALTPLREPVIKTEPRLSLDLKEADLLDVLRLISHKAKVNIVPSPGVKGVVTLRLDDLPWRGVLKMVLTTQGYIFVEEEGVIKVDTEANLIGEVVTKIITLSYADAKIMSGALGSALTKGVGRIDVDARTNSLIITDIPKAIPKMEKIIDELDTMTPQVMIEAKIVEVVLDESNQLGIEWSVFDKGNDLAFGSTFAGGAPGGGVPAAASGMGEAVTGALARGGGSEKGVAYNVAKTLVGSQMAMGDGAGMVFGRITSGHDLNFALNALVSESRANILSAPRIMALNNQPAEIIVGEEIPYTPLKTMTGGKTEVSVSFIDVGIKLSVTPQINVDNFILLKINPEVSGLKGWSADNQPIVSTKEARCQVLAKDGETIVIGGIIDEQGTDRTSKIPFFGDLPFLSPLFKKKITEKRKTELLIFVTPRIIKYGS